MSEHHTNIVPLRPRAANNRGAALDAAVRVAFVRGIRARGWTLDQVARETCYSRQAVCLWLSGKRRIPARAFGVVLGIIVANENARAA